MKASTFAVALTSIVGLGVAGYCVIPEAQSEIDDTKPVERISGPHTVYVQQLHDSRAVGYKGHEYRIVAYKAALNPAAKTIAVENDHSPDGFFNGQDNFVNGADQFQQFQIGGVYDVQLCYRWGQYFLVNPQPRPIDANWKVVWVQKNEQTR